MVACNFQKHAEISRFPSSFPLYFLHKVSNSAHFFFLSFFLLSGLFILVSLFGYTSRIHIPKRPQSELNPLFFLSLLVLFLLSSHAKRRRRGFPLPFFSRFCLSDATKNFLMGPLLTSKRVSSFFPSLFLRSGDREEERDRVHNIVRCRRRRSLMLYITL